MSEKDIINNAKYALPKREGTVKDMVIHLHKAGVKTRDIVEQLQCNYSTACCFISRYNKEVAIRNGVDLTQKQKLENRYAKYLVIVRIGTQGSYTKSGRHKKRSLAYIARAAGVSNSRAFQYLIRHQHGYVMRQDGLWYDSKGREASATELTSLKKTVGVEWSVEQNEYIKLIAEKLGVTYNEARTTAIRRYWEILKTQEQVQYTKPIDDVSN